jgi:hypothetical protein
MDVVEKRKTLVLAGNRNPAAEPVPIQTELCRLFSSVIIYNILMWIC